MYKNIPSGCTTLLFDLGGVLLNLNLQKTYNAFAALGYTNFSTHFDSYSGAPFIETFEVGVLSNEQFINTCITQCYKGTTTTQVLHAWNEMLGDFMHHKLALLQQLSKYYKILLYSNTNALHVAHLHQYYNHTFGTNTVQNVFTKIYYSNEIGIRKPNAEGFVLIMEEQQLQPQQIFYIDDGAMHIATGKQLGMHTLLWQQNDDIATYFEV